MLNKKVLLGTLVAGAMLLPQVASAGVVSGTCVNCHTMHGTDGNNADLGVNPQLTKGDSCAGCHARGQGNTGTTGLLQDVTLTYEAPQVDDETNPNNAGFFSTTATGDIASQQQHNMSDGLGGGSISGMPAETLLSPANPPGGTSAYANIECMGCHTQASGGHHGTGTGPNLPYRMLNFSPTAPGAAAGIDSAYGGAPGTSNDPVEAPRVPNASATTYDATGMNGVCGTCHPDFHGTDGETGQQRPSGTTQVWIRHPTDLVLSDQYSPTTRYDYASNYTTDAEFDLVPVGSSSSSINGTGGAQTLMCITCHYSHGGPWNDLLRFNYAGQEAGGGAQTPGCESCHSYGLTGM